ncbi:MAG TPA: hypothetical protein VGE52_22450 [Pirellulales bacterium]
MNARFWLRSLALCGLLLASLGSPVSAQINLFKRVEADPKKPYALTYEETSDAPWMIMAASFSSEGGKQQAHELVIEIRKTLHVEAWVFEKVFDFSQGAQAKTVDRFGNNHARYARDGQRLETAVLVGRFASVDDPRAAKLLDKIKHTDFESLALKAGKQDFMSLGRLRNEQRAYNLARNDEEQIKKGPLGRAFVTTNPLFPDEYYKQSGVDPLVVKINADVQYSLLKAPGRYTVKIATFTGMVLIDPKRVAALGTANQGINNRLAEAAEKAHNLTMALRAKGVEAYEFHDVSLSMVTVGSFQDVGQVRADGKTELYPQIVQIMNAYGATDMTTGKVGMPKQIVKGIQCDIQPQLVEIPKQRVVTTADRERFRTGLFR